MAWAVVNEKRQVVIHHIRSVESVANDLRNYLYTTRGGEWNVIPVYVEEP